MNVLDRLIPGSSAATGAAAAGLMGLLSVSTDLVGLPDQSILERVLEKGGLVGVIVLLVWFYRRDWIRLADQQALQTQLVIDLAKDANNAQKSTAVAIQANTDATRALTDAVKDLKK